MSKKNIRLFIVLLILIGVAYIYQKPYQNWKSNKDKADNFLSDINIEKIDKIEISAFDNTSSLVKKNEQWKVDDSNFNVRPDLKENLFNALREAKDSDLELVSNNSNKKSEYQTDISGTNIKLYQNGNIAADFIVGSLGNDFQSTYISKPEIGDTYLVDANLFGAVNIYEWRDTFIFASNQESINKIRFQYPDREFTIEKNEEGWKGISPNEFEVNEDQLNDILDIMASLQATQIPEQTFEGTGLEKNLIIVQATGNGVDNTIMIGEANDSDQYFVKRGDSDNIYLITKTQRDTLDKTIQDFK